MPYLEALNFNLVGYGCTTCIGNSGPLPDAVSAAVKKDDLVVAAVLSGNRNFEGRINPQVKANYLASPPLVVAYALAGASISIWRRSAGHGHRRQAGLSARYLADAPGSETPRSTHHQRGDVRARNTRRLSRAMRTGSICRFRLAIFIAGTMHPPTSRGRRISIT